MDHIEHCAQENPDFLLLEEDDDHPEHASRNFSDALSYKRSARR